jgi:hypothetical protein
MRKSEGKRPLGSPRLYGVIMLKETITKQEDAAGLMGLRLAISDGLFLRGNEPSGCTKRGNFLGIWGTISFSRKPLVTYCIT